MLFSLVICMSAVTMEHRYAGKLREVHMSHYGVQFAYMITRYKPVRAIKLLSESRRLFGNPYLLCGTS